MNTINLDTDARFDKMDKADKSAMKRKMTSLSPVKSKQSLRFEILRLNEAHSPV